MSIAPLRWGFFISQKLFNKPVDGLRICGIMVCMESREMTYKSVRANPVTPMHEVRDEAKLQSIIASMESTGWTGRPVLVFDDAEGQYKAITGSHRIAAAKAVGIEIPVAIISDDDCAIVIDELDYASDDYDREKVLRDAGLIEAADIMAAEIEANEAEWV